MRAGFLQPATTLQFLLGMFVWIAVSAAQAQVQGDVNCDGHLNGGDLPPLVAVLFGDASSDCGASDVNRDGLATAADIAALVAALDPPNGPVITSVGLAGADGRPTAPLGTINGTPVFFRNTGSGFQLVVEARAGLSGQPPGATTFNSDAADPLRRPDIQIESSAPLGDGSRAVCDGGVPAVNPPDFGPSQTVADTLNDLACRLPPAATAPNSACTQDGFGRPSFMGVGTQAQFCLLVPRTLEFPVDETVLSVRWRDTAGNLGPLQQLILRVGSGPIPPTFTASPTTLPTRTHTPTLTATVPPSMTPSSTRSATRTHTSIPPSATPSATPSPAGTNRRSPTATHTGTRTSSTPPATATQTPLHSRTATVTASTTRTGTHVRTDTPSATPTRTPIRPSATATRTATRTPAPSFTATGTISPTFSRTPTVTRTRTPPPTATRTPTPTRTRTSTATPTNTPVGPIGPVITYFGLTRADDTLLPRTDTTPEGVPIYVRQTRAGFSIVVEGGPGPSGVPVGRFAFDVTRTSLPDLQIQVSRPLGDGSVAVCDRSGSMPGGVSAVDPPSFDETPDVIAAVNDLACRFVNGGDIPVARNRDEACIMYPSGEFSFARMASTVEFCGFVTRFMEFPPDDTLVTARLRDQAGNPGAPAQIIVRVSP